MRNLLEKIDRTKTYDLENALNLLLETATAKFDETVDLALRLGVNPRHAEQQVRSTVVLPHGTGRSIRIVVLTKGEKATEAKEAGADYVGDDELIERIKGGWLEFDACVATPDMMRDVGKLGRILGPRGLMPNPKSGTVTFDIARVVGELKSGKIEFRVDRSGNVHVPVGKVSFGAEKLAENIKMIFDAVLKARPSAFKGQYIKSITISSTMGPGVKLDVTALTATIR